MKSNMKNKKTPASTNKKKSLPAASSRSHRKAAREGVRNSQSNDGSYLVSDANASSEVPAMQLTSNSAPGETNNTVLMAFLQKLDDSNRQIMRRMDDLERRNTINSTPVGSPSTGARLVTIDERPTVQNHRSQCTAGPSEALNPRELFAAHPPPTVPELPGQVRGNRRTSASAEDRRVSAKPSLVRSANSELFAPSNGHLNNHIFRSTDDSAVRQPTVPTVDALRRMPTVNDAVTQLLSHYEQGTGQELVQGKPVSKQSGRYNNTDTSALYPQFRWPNEGYTGGATKKRIGYDDLSVPQWVAGQLTNAIQIQDNDVLRSVLTQMVFTMRDASSIPWPAVREAYACSMHEVEEGRLAWSDSTQWALNRLSASQVALVNGRTLSQQQKGRTCRYYNENSCTHEGHHGIYKHNCAYCWKQGRSNTHPETKCHLKGSIKQQDEQASK